MEGYWRKGVGCLREEEEPASWERDGVAPVPAEVPRQGFRIETFVPHLVPFAEAFGRSRERLEDRPMIQ